MSFTNIKTVTNTVRSGGWAVRNLHNHHQVAIRINLDLEYHWATILQDHVGLFLQMEIRPGRSENPLSVTDFVVSGAFLHQCLHRRISVSGERYDQDQALDSVCNWFMIYLKLEACDLGMLLEDRLLLEALCDKEGGDWYGSGEEDTLWPTAPSVDDLGTLLADRMLIEDCDKEWGNCNGSGEEEAQWPVESPESSVSTMPSCSVSDGQWPRVQQAQTPQPLQQLLLGQSGQVGAQIHPAVSPPPQAQAQQAFTLQREQATPSPAAGPSVSPPLPEAGMFMVMRDWVQKQAQTPPPPTPGFQAAGLPPQALGFARPTPGGDFRKQKTSLE